MATWQFRLILIPSSWAEEHKYSSSTLYDEEGYDTERAWKNRQPESGFIETLNEVLLPSKAWHDNLMSWGNEAEHDIQVWYENENIDGIHVRLAVHKELDEIIIKVVRAAKTLNCALFFPELSLITAASEIEIKSAISNSNAIKFVRNPHEFLKKISENA